MCMHINSQRKGEFQITKKVVMVALERMEDLLIWVVRKRESEYFVKNYRLDFFHKKKEGIYVGKMKVEVSSLLFRQIWELELVSYVSGLHVTCFLL